MHGRHWDFAGGDRRRGNRRFDGRCRRWWHGRRCWRSGGRVLELELHLDQRLAGKLLVDDLGDEHAVAHRRLDVPASLDFLEARRIVELGRLEVRRTQDVAGEIDIGLTGLEQRIDDDPLLVGGAAGHERHADTGEHRLGNVLADAGDAERLPELELRRLRRTTLWP